MLFEEEKLNHSSNNNSFISKFHAKIVGKNLASSILIPSFYLEFEELLMDLVAKIANKEITSFSEIEFLKLTPNENGNILMEDWQTALQFCQKTALIGTHKFLIIQDIQSISINLANALLKILEEPPEGTFILLSYKSLGDILPTIKSRCILLDFQKSSESFNFLYDSFIKSPEDKKCIQDLCFLDPNLLALFKTPSSLLLLKLLDDLLISFNYNNFKEFFSKNSSKPFFEEICFLFIEDRIYKGLKKNINILSFYNFYFNKKYVKLYNINSEGFLYYTFYYICKNL